MLRSMVMAVLLSPSLQNKISYIFEM